MPDNYTQTQSNVSLLQQYPDLFRMINPPAPVPFPELPSIPTPQRIDESRVAQLTQQFASPAIRAGRMGLREVMAGGSRGTPIQQSYRARGGIAGMGDVISSGIASARSPALGIAGQEATSAAETEKLRTDLEWKKRLMTFEEARKQQEQTYEQQIAEQQRMIGQRISEQQSARQRDKEHKKSMQGGGVNIDTGSYERSKAASDAEWKRMQEMDTSPVDPYTMKPYKRDTGTTTQGGYISSTPYEYTTKAGAYSSDAGYPVGFSEGGMGTEDLRQGDYVKMGSQAGLANYSGYNPYTNSTFNPNYNTNYYNNDSSYNTEPSLGSYSSEGY